MDRRTIMAIGAATATALFGAAAADPVQTRQPFAQTMPGADLALTMVPIPGGDVRLAGSEGTTVVAVDPFWMSATEVPWDAYDVYAFGLDRTHEEVSGAVDAVSRPTKPYGAADRGYGHDGYAALGMTYQAAAQFAAWLSGHAGRGFRLPTEAEWLLACRSGEKQTIDVVAWTWDTFFEGPQRVATRAPNPLGIYDMLGNVAEWAVGLDGQPRALGGSFQDKNPEVSCEARQTQTPAWNARDPQMPKSQWWLSDAPFVGFRLVTNEE